MIEINSRNIRIWSRLGPSGAVGTAAIELAQQEKTNVFCTADLCYFSGLDRLKSSFPQQFYNFGIAEQNMIGIAGGLAKEGLIPFATTYASFATSRCLDQVRVNMAYMKLPIKLIGLTAGFGAGILGATHMSVEDIAIMRALPNMVVLSPADCTEIIKCMLAAAKTESPTYIRLTGPMNTPVVYNEDYNFEIGKAVTLEEGCDICFIATGSVVYEALQARKMLQEKNISVALMNMHTIKPLDEDILQTVMNRNFKRIYTIEEHSVIGGLGSCVAEYISERNRDCIVTKIGIPDCFVTAGDYHYQLEQCGLTANRIYNRVLQDLERKG